LIWDTLIDRSARLYKFPLAFQSTYRAKGTIERQTLPAQSVHVHGVKRYSCTNPSVGDFNWE